jgi:uncharacterized protein (DUF927 family)
MSGTPDMIAAALWYAQHGFPVFPCKPRAKEPLTRHGFKDATTDPDQVKAWWTEWPEANIAMPTGAVSGLVFLDCDPRNGGPVDRSELIERFGPIADTPEAITGGGGRHYVFRDPSVPLPKTLASGIDVKADGGYVLLAPSIHPSGKRYEWDGIAGAKGLLNPAPAPAWLIQGVSNNRKLERPEEAVDDEKWPTGERNTRLASVAGTMRRRGLCPEAIEAALLEQNQRCCEPPLTDNEVRQIAKSVASYAPARKGDTQTPKQTWSFEVNDEGVYWLGQDQDSSREPIKLASRIDVVAKTRSSEGENWGRLLRWKDDEGRIHEWAMPMEALASDAGGVRARLMSEGLSIATSARLRERFVEYLQTAPTEKLARNVTRLGWHDSTYVLPDQAIGQGTDEVVLYQSAHESAHYFQWNGSPEDWRAHVGSLCTGNSRLILSVSCAFAGPLLSLVGAECGGIHLHGGTSSGKTTALIVGGSACGGGGRNGFVQSWRATINGFEAIAEAHNDSTLFLDELAQVDARDAAETAYLLGNGQGKSRMTRSLGARRKPTWTLLFVSAGELTLAEHAATAGKKTKGGVEVRLLNIPADAGRSMGIFENLHGYCSPDAFSRALKQAAQRYYGSPLRAFITELVHKRAEVESSVKNAHEAFIRRFVPVNASGEVRRAADRLSLIGAAGELATEYGLTGWRETEAINTAGRCFDEWLRERGTLGASDNEAAVRQVRSFLEAHGTSRFQLLTNGQSSHEAQMVRDRAGFRRISLQTGETEYLILSEAFRKEVCGGFSYKAVATELDRRKLLLRELPHLTIKRELPEIGSARVYCVRSAILGGEEY